MKPALQLKLSQSLTLTPQLQQSIKLLQLSTLDLNQEIERFLQENPMLEREDDGEVETFPLRDDTSAPPQAQEAETSQESSASEESTGPDFDADDALGDNYWNEAGGNRRNDDDDEYDAQANVAQLPTLRDHLQGQLGLLPISRHDRAVATMITSGGTFRAIARLTARGIGYRAGRVANRMAARTPAGTLWRGCSQSTRLPCVTTRTDGTRCRSAVGTRYCQKVARFIGEQGLQ
jgi:hypothetical protein